MGQVQTLEDPVFSQQNCQSHLDNQEPEILEGAGCKEVTGLMKHLMSGRPLSLDIQDKY